MKQEITLEVLAEFHARYETIHPFQDGNGRTGRLILFRECLRNDLCPIVIEDRRRSDYLEALQAYRENKSTNFLVKLLEEEQKMYFEKCLYFIPR